MEQAAQAAPTLRIARLATVEYSRALALQEGLAAARARGAVPDTLLLLEHPSVFTLGRGADARYLLNPPREVPVYRVSRGGQVTYHGPGQLVGYPIVKLEGRARDVHDYLRCLEQVMIDALLQCGIAAGRRPGLTGVWVEERKVGSIGVGLRRWVTMHGFALNVATDGRFFETIVPCGIAGCRMTSVAAEGRADLGVTEMAAFIERSFTTVFSYRQVVTVEANELWTASRAFSLPAREASGPDPGLGAVCQC